MEMFLTTLNILVWINYELNLSLIKNIKLNKSCNKTCLIDSETLPKNGYIFFSQSLLLINNKTKNYACTYHC